MSKHLSNSERLRILEEYLNDSSSKYTIQKKYGLLSGNIYTFKEHFTLGRDNFYALLRANDLMLRKRRYRPRTTNSNHRFHRYEDLLNTEPKLVPQRVGELVVADITYISCQEGFAYLSLFTDAYSRCIVGYCVHDTLEVDGPLSALN